MKGFKHARVAGSRVCLLLCVFEAAADEAHLAARRLRAGGADAARRRLDPLQGGEAASLLGTRDAISTYLQTLNVSSESVGGTRQDVVPLADTSAPVQTNTSVVRQHVVVAKYDEDVSWLSRLPANLDIVVYQSLDPHAPHFVENVGNEASKYLSFIVDNYDSLPETVVFVQAGEMDWHDPVSKEITLHRWSWGHAKEKGGLAFLPTAAPCLIEDTSPGLQHLSKDQEAEAIPSQEVCPMVVEHVPRQMDTLRSVWPSIFEAELGPMPSRWFTRCCAQFEVTRDAIRQHPQEFYRQLLDWTMQHDRDLASEGQVFERNHDSEGRRDSGHVLEVMWALIFADPASRSSMASRMPQS